MICEPGQVVVVPFPFVEIPVAKRRPALILSTADFNSHGQSVAAMITSSRSGSWPGDVEIHDLVGAGLPKPSLVRLKLFTIDNRLLLRQLGALSPDDRSLVDASLRKCFGL